MSVTSCVRHPAKARFLKIYQWQLDFCEGNQCAAALLSHFEFCHNWKIQQSEHARRENDALQTEGKERTQNETLLQWHTAKDLVAAVMLFKRDTIQKAIDTVLVPKGVIEVHKNPNPRQWFDHTKFFLFQPDVLNDWLDAHPPQTIDEKSSIPGETGIEAVKSVKHTIDEKSSIGNENPSIDDEKSSSSFKEDVQRRQPKGTKTKGPARALAKSIAVSEKPVVVVSPVDSVEGDEEQTVEDLAVEFAASKKQTQALAGYVAKRGPSAAVALAAYARPFPNRVQRFWAGVRDDYTPAEKVAVPEPKAKAVEPVGWQEAYRRMSRNRYGIEDPEVYAYWKNVPPSVRLDVLAELERPTTEGKPAGQPAAVDFKQARAAVQNAGKPSKGKA